MPEMDQPLYRLGLFIPESDYNSIPMEEFLYSHGWVAQKINQRYPEQVSQLYLNDRWVSKFHRDGHVSWGQWAPKWISIWSNVGGTMIRYPTRFGYRVIVAKPLEVIVINNRLCVHRATFSNEPRLFIRGWGLRPTKGE